jgi:hypothetical protein
MVTVTDGQLDIGFIHDIEDPMVDAIEVSDAPTIRVNTGGAAYTDAAGNTWSADTGFNTGTAASFGSQAIAGTDDDVLYQTERWDDGASPEMQYSFTVPNGAYQVKLHFAENAFSATGVRVFSVDMEGTRQITDLDVFATVGAHAALVTTSLVRVADGQLNIGFVHNVEDPMIDAIEILPQTSGTPVPRYEVFELELTSSQTYSNPFTDVAVTATFSGPSNQQVTAQGFYDGGNTWRVRFAPDEIGTWTYVTDSDDNANSGLNAQSGTFNCVTQNNPAPVSNHGFIKVDPARKYYFQFSDGTPFYGVGDTAYGLPNGISDEQLDDYLDLRKSQGFNFIRFFASGFPFRVNGDTYAGPIQRSDGLPWQDASDSLWSAQLTRPNVAYFQRLDGILAKLKQRGMYAEVEVFNYYSPPFHYTDLWTTEVETIWAKYVVSRLSAYSSVFLWTVTNEYEIYPSNQYPPACSVHTPGDDDDVWADDMGNLFHSFDAHGHPTTVHNVTFDSDGGVGQRFGEATGIDVITHQRWGPDNPADFTNCPSLVDPNRIEQTLTVDSGYDKPVINTENGYEYAPGDTAGVSTDHVRQAAWRVFVGGGATLAAGFGNTWLGTDNVGGTLDGPDFEGGELGASDQITHLANFIAGIDYHNMGTAHNLVDNNNLVFRKTGVEYIVYAPAGGSFDLNLSGVPGTFSVEWFNPRTGGTSAGSNVSGGSSLSFTSPDSNDWVLHLVAL